MREYQGRLHRDPAAAKVTLGGASHALVPTQVVARGFPDALRQLVGPDVAFTVMYRFGYLIGKAQSEAFFEDRAIEPSDVLYRVLTGPFHLAWAGYADVDLLVWEPYTDARFAILWESDTSFSARDALGERRARTCSLQAGYSAGWCTVATGLPLEACELACRAEGVSHCRFLIGHADQVRDHLLDARFHQPTDRYGVRPARIVAPVPT
jgi:hypothetical protein